MAQTWRRLAQRSGSTFYSTTGAVIYGALRLVDRVQTARRTQSQKRPLTDRERKLLRPIFGDSLNYDAIRIVDGPAGLLTRSGRALTMGFTIYLPTYEERTLVHECVHTWQYQSTGFRYIGNSAFHQLHGIAFNRNYRPYDWRPLIDAGATWLTLRSIEAQAKFIEDLYAAGTFAFTDSARAQLTTPGSFFREDESGTNAFLRAGTPYTTQANAAWQILRTAVTKHL
jgi:hypothetical protein